MINQTLIDRRAAELIENKKWAAQRFGILESEIVDYNSGCCYSKMWVTNMEAAKKVAATVPEAYYIIISLTGKKPTKKIMQLAHDCYNAAYHSGPGYLLIRKDLFVKNITVI